MKAQKRVALLEKMKALIGDDEPEGAHGEADDLLCQALLLHGEKELVELWKQVSKWYA